MQKAAPEGGFDWNCKPQAMLPLLDQGFEEVVWLDSDILVNGPLGGLLDQVRRQRGLLHHRRRCLHRWWRLLDQQALPPGPDRQHDRRIGWGDGDHREAPTAGSSMQAPQASPPGVGKVPPRLPHRQPRSTRVQQPPVQAWALVPSGYSLQGRSTRRRSLTALPQPVRSHAAPAVP